VVGVSRRPGHCRGAGLGRPVRGDSAMAAPGSSTRPVPAFWAHPPPGEQCNAALPKARRVEAVFRAQRRRPGPRSSLPIRFAGLTSRRCFHWCAYALPHFSKGARSSNSANSVPRRIPSRNCFVFLDFITRGSIQRGPCHPCNVFRPGLRRSQSETDLTEKKKRIKKKTAAAGLNWRGRRSRCWTPLVRQLVRFSKPEKAAEEGVPGRLSSDGAGPAGPSPRRLGAPA